jgi:branched-subunit amino acid ABC-type transport system permease component
MRGMRVLRDLLPFLIGGVVAGSVYGLAAAGLVLSYKTSGIFNFAHGAIGAAGAFLFYELRDVRGLPWPVGMIASVCLAAPLFGLLLSVVAASLAKASTAHRIVATVGLLLAVQGAVQLRYGVIPKTLTSPFPTSTFSVFGTNVGYDQVLTIIVAASAVAGLTLMFRVTRIGLQMRAVVDSSELLDLSGVSPRRVRAVAWMIGSTFAALTGILLAPTVGLDSVLLTLLVVQAVGAAALGRFRNLTATFVGGLIIGVAQALLRAPDIRDNIPFVKSLPGLPESVAFLVLFGVLLLARRGVFTDVAIVRPPWTPRLATARSRAALLFASVATVVLLPHVVSDRYPVLIQTAVFVTIFASLHLLVEVSGQVSLCHAAFVAVGAASFTHFTTGAGMPWALGAALAVLVVLPLGAIVAIPSIRLSGLFLALATFGFGIVVEQMAYSRPIMFGALGARYGHRPAVLGLDGDLGYFYLCAGVAMLAILAVLLLRRMRLGRLLGALADSPTALVTHGLSINVTRVLVFCVAAGMAGFAGVLYVGVVGSVSASGASPAALNSFNSLLWFVMLAISGRSALTAPVVAATALFLAPSYSHSPHLVQYTTIGFGSLAMLIVSFGPRIRAWVDSQSAASERRRAHSPVSSRLDSHVAPTVGRAHV